MSLIDKKYKIRSDYPKELITSFIKTCEHIISNDDGCSCCRDCTNCPGYSIYNDGIKCIDNGFGILSQAKWEKIHINESAMRFLKHFENQIPQRIFKITKI